jgi:hypothetical protein
MSQRARFIFDNFIKPSQSTKTQNRRRRYK